MACKSVMMATQHLDGSIIVYTVYIQELFLNNNNNLYYSGENSGAKDKKH